MFKCLALTLVYRDIHKKNIYINIFTSWLLYNYNIVCTHTGCYTNKTVDGPEKLTLWNPFPFL